MTTTPANPGNLKIEAIRQSVQHSFAALNELIDGPLAEIDLQKLYQPPAENEWTIMQNLAHVAEFMPYWANEVAKLVANPGQKFGRVMADERRIKFISDHEHDTLPQIRSLLPTSYARLEEVLGTLKDSDLELTGVHIRYGEKSLDWFIEEFVTKHMSDHVVQLREELQGVS
ncbi:MAG TPA: DinB family protein [Ktedonobacteraceae bacterium]|nr:DinB family protein [Ktedonobacteraceae bacterium]